MQFDGRNVTQMPFNSADYDCSDACPAGSGMIYSSTQNGGYDLYYFDGNSSVPLTTLNNAQNDLGADFFAMPDGHSNAADAAALQSWLLTQPDNRLQNGLAGDLNCDGKLNAADFSLLKRKLILNTSSASSSIFYSKF